MWWVLTASASAGGGYAEAMAKYGIPGLLVFAAGVLLPAAIKSRRALGSWSGAAVSGVWLLILGTAIVWVVAQARGEFRKKWVIEGVTTGIDKPQTLKFDDETVYKRQLFGPDGKARWEWALVTDYPIKGSELTLQVLGADGFTVAAFKIQPGDDTLHLDYDPVRVELRQVNPPTTRQPQRVDRGEVPPALALSALATVQP